MHISVCIPNPEPRAQKQNLHPSPGDKKALNPQFEGRVFPTAHAALSRSHGWGKVPWLGCWLCGACSVLGIAMLGPTRGCTELCSVCSPYYLSIGRGWALAARPGKRPDLQTFSADEATSRKGAATMQSPVNKKLELLNGICFLLF